MKYISDSVKMTEKPLAWFVLVGLALLFISGCWMVGSLTIVPRRSELKFLRTALLTTAALANISFPIAILTSILGLAEIVGEEKARKANAYAFLAGIIFLIISIILFSWIVASQLQWSYYD